MSSQKKELLNNKKFIISFGRTLKTQFYKIIGKNKETGIYTINQILRLAKYQNKLKDENIKISVIIPNYNYESFLIRRLYSVLSQNVKLFEIIILDDCSKDNSRELIDNIYDKIKDYINIKKIYNTENSGTPFKQWAKGIKEAKGDYVWIAEADDYCSKKMLFNLLEPLRKYDNVYISYVDTAFTDKNGNVFLKSVKSQIDLMKTGHWDESYVNDGTKEIKKYSFLNNTIANVSSCIIKKDDYSDIYQEIGNYRQAGDWVFYINVMARGKVAYIDKTMNYYRVHGEQVTSQMKKEKHIEEIERIYKSISDKFGTNEFQIKKRKERIEFLKEVWKI